MIPKIENFVLTIPATFREMGTAYLGPTLSIDSRRSLSRVTLTIRADRVEPGLIHDITQVRAPILSEMNRQQTEALVKQLESPGFI